MVAGTVKIKKNYNEYFFSLCHKTGVRSVFFFYVFFPCFHLRVASLRISFCNRLEYSLFLICATRFLLILFSSLTRIHVHIHLHIYIYIYTCSLRAYHIVYSASGLCGGTLYGRNAVFNTFRHTRRHTFSGLSI